MQEHKEFTQLISGKLPAGWDSALPKPTPEDKGKATRLHSQDNLNAASSVLSGTSPTRHRPRTNERLPCRCHVGLQAEEDGGSG